MLVFCILPPVEVYVVTVLAPILAPRVAPPVHYTTQNHAHTMVKPCRNCDVPLAHALIGVIDQTLKKGKIDMLWETHARDDFLGVELLLHDT